MKKVLFLVICLSFVIFAVNAKPVQSDYASKPLESPAQGKLVNNTRTSPVYEFTKTPTVLLESFYDYMIGSYNGIPIRNIPNGDGGYFLTYHGKRTADGSRRVFYAHLNADGGIVNQNEITQATVHEGYPSLGVDPVSAKPMYAWHASLGSPDDPNYVEFTSDAFLEGLSGCFNEVQVIVDNPLEVLIDGGVASTDNEFIWPTIQIGPSPINGMRRAYVANRNAVSHNVGEKPSENIHIAWADFDANMIEMGTPLEWNHSSIPEMDQWNHDDDWRRPFHAITTDDLGNVFYAGYHFAYTAAEVAIVEPDVDIFMCPNYGEGTWSRITEFGNLPTWNPPGTPGGTGYFVGDGDVPYADNEIHWGIVNSSHLNAVTSSNGRVIFPVVYAVSTDGGSYYPAFQNVKTVTYNTNTNDFTVSDVYPQKHPDDDFNVTYTPWDREAPWGEAEHHEASDGGYYILEEGGAERILQTVWPFPHWDDTLHNSSMMFHCNNIKLSEPNADGLMVAVWQDAMRARLYNQYPDSYPEFAAYSNTPEIFIALSSDNGKTWSQPIMLNNVDTPELTNIKPMWIYPADKVITTGTDSEGNYIGKIGLMFFDDYTWGANAIAPPAHSVNDGGAVMFAEMQMTFGPGDSNNDGTAPQITRILNQNYPNPFNPETNISFDMPVNGKAKLDIYNVKGQLVKSLFDGIAPFGRTSLVWDSTDNGGKAVSSGIYFYRLTTENHSESRKMMLMK